MTEPADQSVDAIAEIMKKIKLEIADIPYWKQERVETLFKEFFELAYKKGREDQKYVDRGPSRIDLYARG